MALFICTKCETQYPKWQGRCSECQAWSTIKESIAQPERSKATGKIPGLGKEELQDLSQVKSEQIARFSSQIREVDQVLGGGLVPGSLVLVGGQPGIGKSTLVLQLASSLISNKQAVFYFSGEESAQQLKLRADRLKLSMTGLIVSNTTNVDVIISTLREHKPQLAIIDSIQTMWTEDAEGSAGGIAQVRTCATKLLEVAKQSGITILIIGHVTKDGAVAGPKTLEHLVDTVLYLEGERLESIRLLRAIKNRFGPSGEVGVLAMTQSGLQPIQDSSRLFLSASQQLVGTSLGALVDGSRIFMTDLNALVEKTQSPYPRRTVIGFDTNRLQVLLAILHRYTGLNLSAYDVYVHLPGGLKSVSPSLDLAVCLALTSAKRDKPLSDSTVLVGEVGLNGNLRSVTGQAKILQEAIGLGFKKIILPQGTKKLTSSKIEIIELNSINEVVQKLLL